MDSPSFIINRSIGYVWTHKKVSKPTFNFETQKCMFLGKHIFFNKCGRNIHTYIHIYIYIYIHVCIHVLPQAPEQIRMYTIKWQVP